MPRTRQHLIEPERIIGNLGQPVINPLAFKPLHDVFEIVARGYRQKPRNDDGGPNDVRCSSFELNKDTERRLLNR